jgi:hypothetical protein
MTEPAAPCDRFARDGALAMERDAIEGGGIDAAHLAGCADCRAARDAYLRLAGAVRAARPEPALPAGWQDGVRRRIAVARRRSRARWIGGAVLAAAAAAIALWLVRPGPGEPIAALQTSILRGSGAMRATEARPGDRLQLAARVDPARAGELRVYRLAPLGALILRCAPGDPAAPAACDRRGDQLSAEAALPVAGRYRAALFAGAWPDAAGHVTGSLDQDVAAARAAGLEVVLDDPIDVR